MIRNSLVSQLYNTLHFKEANTKRLLALIFIASVGILFYLNAYYSIWIIDDTQYRYNFANNERIQTVSDIFQSQNAHYFLWNGRYVAHWLVQFTLCFIGRAGFSFLNACAAIALIFTLLKVSKSDETNLQIIIVASLLFLLYDDVPYTPTFQIGYIWMAILSLSFVILFFGYAKSRATFCKCALLFIFALLAGNAHEVFNLGIGGSLCIYGFLNIKKLTINQWLMGIGFAIGLLFICLSTGTMNRSGERSISLLYSILTIIPSLKITYVFIVIFAYKIIKEGTSPIKFYRNNTFFINASVILLLFNFIIGIGTYRQLLGIELISCILILRLLHGDKISQAVLGLGSIISQVDIYPPDQSAYKKFRY